MDPAVRAQIERTIQDNPVVLCMKGTRDQPRCGFSAQIVGVLDQLLGDYATRDVLSDPVLREGIKEYSSWPTIPQLYVRGEFIGGSDIVAALDVSGELREKLGELVQSTLPKVTVTAAARAELSAALESKEEAIRLDVSPTFEHDLAVGVPDPNDVVLDVDGLRVSLPRSAARRADGIVVDLVATPEGPAFKVDNPNEPARVKRLSPKELKARLGDSANLMLVDVRPEGERALASISGFRELNEALQRELFEGPRDREIVVLCHHGMRSHRAAEELVQQGFRNVFNLVGGIDAWSSDVDPSVPKY
jgi:monothiol glutaredoxin